MKKSLREIFLGAALALAAVVVATPQSSFGQASPINLQSLTNGVTLPPSAATNQNNIILLTRDCDLAAAFQFFTTNGTATVTIAGSFSIDQTNFGLAPFTLSGTASSNNLAAVLGGTNIPPVNIWTNWQHSQIAGFTAVNFYSWTNSSSGSTVFNAGAKINRPTINTATY